MQKTLEGISLTKTKVHPVAHGGIDAKIGAKKIEIRKQMPVVTAVRPVRPPSAIPAPDSINAVTGETPNSDPIAMPITIAAFTLYIMRYAVSAPPQMSPIHNYVSSQYLDRVLRGYEITYLGILQFVALTLAKLVQKLRRTTA